MDSTRGRQARRQAVRWRWSGDPRGWQRPGEPRFRVSGSLFSQRSAADALALIFFSCKGLVEGCPIFMHASNGSVLKVTLLANVFHVKMYRKFGHSNCFYRAVVSSSFCEPGFSWKPHVAQLISSIFQPSSQPVLGWDVPDFVSYFCSNRTNLSMAVPTVPI